MPFSKTYAVNVAQTFPDFPYAKSFQRIMQLLDDKDAVKKHLEVLNGEIVRKVSKERGPNDEYSAAQALYDILRKSELEQGFHKTQVCYVTGVLSAQKFLAMMNDKMAFLDPNVTPLHGAETHRIQWWMIARDMDANRDQYDPVSASDLFKSTADLSATGPRGAGNVWYHALDADQGRCDSARAPESLKAYIVSKPAYSKIAEAEALQMKLDTCVKMPWSKAKTLSPQKRLMDKNWEVKEYK